MVLCCLAGAGCLKGKSRVMCKDLLLQQWDVRGRMEERVCVFWPSPSLCTSSGPWCMPRGHGPNGSEGFSAGAEKDIELDLKLVGLEEH